MIYLRGSDNPWTLLFRQPWFQGDWASRGPKEVFVLREVRGRLSTKLMAQASLWVTEMPGITATTSE